MPRLTVALCLLLIATTGSLAAQGSCGPGMSPVLLLGSYHMANPGQDGANVEADDVRSPRRQAELTVLLDHLERFRPTKVLIEAPYGSDTWPDRYTAWLAGEYELGRNEIEQIGFALARRAGLETVHPIDFPMWMNGWTAAELEFPPPDPNATPSPPSERERELTARLRASTISAYLAWLHTPAEVRRNHGTYLTMLEARREPGIYANTDQVTNWYKRNLRMYTNVNRVVTPGTDRVFLLVGAGHLTILRQLFEASDRYCLENVEPYLAG